jgi:hypothetical protein
MTLYETLLLGFVVLAVLAGLAFSVLTTLSPTDQEKPTPGHDQRDDHRHHGDQHKGRI